MDRITLSLRGVKAHVRGKGISSVGPASCRSFVTPDSDPGSSLDSRVRGNDDGRDAHPTGDCFAALAIVKLAPSA